MGWRMTVAGILIALGVMGCGTPVVEYSSATRQPTGCIVEPDGDGVNRIPVSDPRCKEIIKGRHTAEWVP